MDTKRKNPAQICPQLVGTESSIQPVAVADAVFCPRQDRRRLVESPRTQNWEGVAHVKIGCPKPSCLAGRSKSRNYR
jgi:hypothetical protein